MDYAFKIDCFSFFAALICSSSAIADPGDLPVRTDHYTGLIIDCEDSSIENAGTRDTVIVRMEGATGQPFKTSFNIGNGLPNSFSPVFEDGEAVYSYKSPYAGTGISPVNVFVTTNGGDALWIDEAILQRRVVKEINRAVNFGVITLGRRTVHEETLQILGHWGRDGGS